MTTGTKDQLKARINAALSAHAMWKGRLKAAIQNGTSDQDPAVVRRDDRCEFGKWLYGETDAAVRGCAHYGKVKQLHAEFHQHASRVLELALTGRKAEATAGLDLSAPFTSSSLALTNELMAWRETT